MFILILIAYYYYYYYYYYYPQEECSDAHESQSTFQRGTKAVGHSESENETNPLILPAGDEQLQASDSVTHSDEHSSSASQQYDLKSEDILMSLHDTEQLQYTNPSIP